MDISMFPPLLSSSKNMNLDSQNALSAPKYDALSNGELAFIT
jgi:hypothetical protein